MKQGLKITAFTCAFMLIAAAFSGCLSQDSQPETLPGESEEGALPATSPGTGEVGETEGTFPEENETLVYEGVRLTPIADQGNFAYRGTQYIDRESYRLEIVGLVDRPVSFSYEDLLAFPAASKVVTLESVDGWNFTAKWTGVPLETLFEDAGLQEGTSHVIFYGVDEYSTALPLDYLIENEIILAYRLNDLPLPPERGFPVQVVAEGKYGYKWAKWVVRMEITDEPYRGYWERQGYSDRADVGGPGFEDFGMVEKIKEFL